MLYVHVIIVFAKRFNPSPQTTTLQVLPGLLLCFAMRVDCERIVSSSLGGGGVRGGLGTATHGLLVCCQQWSYFAVALVGYGCGLMVASFVADWYRVAQPALLYLVPGVLIPLIVKAFLQVHVHMCMSYVRVHTCMS